jgi:hypothetical protein
MDASAAILLFVFSALFSIVFQWGSPKVMAYPKFAKLQTSYAGKTFLTAVTVFVFLVAVSFAMAKVAEKPRLPG